MLKYLICIKKRSIVIPRPKLKLRIVEDWEKIFDYRLRFTESWEWSYTLRIVESWEEEGEEGEGG